MTAYADKFFRDESGATMIEYALIVTLIAVACITALTLVYSSVAGFFTTVANAM
ncbi:MAG TPA: Flp family type IVb pilin [Candidatus Baltobacteraceae bacterium]